MYESMLREEFEQQTGIFPCANMYRAIEAAYTDFPGDKATFCMAYKDNENGMAESIQRECDMEYVQGFIKPMSEKEARIVGLQRDIDRFKEQLDREQEWRPYESPHNVQQADYEKLASSVPNAAHYMTDEEAIAWICDEYDFNPAKITILHEIAAEEINRHNQCRQSGAMIDRRPIYCATDYHYIRFNTSRWYYEVWNDQLHPFYC